ncbi:MAG: zinc ribbon domain-containing protein [Chloroflexota bacterium]|nr:zinc ribbon domain-containing protein [Chloroflexota bacterium]
MMTEKITCPECGAENFDDAEFCIVCHAHLREDSTSAFIDPQQPDQDDFDLLMGEEDDLPGLLNALKQADGDETAEDRTQENELSAITPEDEFDEEDTQEDQGIPGWLHRVRQRATEEEDSTGDITQKISAAKESLKGDKPSSQHENFETWIQKLRDPIGGVVDREPELGDSSDELEEEQEEVQEKESEWLQKIRKAEGKQDITEDERALDHGENGLLNWLAALEDGEEEASGEQGDSDIDAEEAGESDEVGIDESSVTQEISVDDRPLSVTIPPKLSVTDKDRSQADQLSSMILDETAPRLVRAIKRRSKLGAARFFFAVLLILSISLSLFVGEAVVNQSGAIQPHTDGFLSWIKDLEQGAGILLIFDYQPAYSSEINLIASPILVDLVSRESDLSFLSSSMSGAILQRQLIGDIPGLDTDSITDLGYFPIGAYGAFGMGIGISTGWQIVGLPESASAFPDGGFDSILILSDTYGGARAWIEQLTVLMPDTPINLVVTAQAMPMLVPYFDSGQIMGMVSGLNDSLILEAELSTDVMVGARRRAYQVGLVILAAVMVMGAINAGNQNDEDGGTA